MKTNSYLLKQIELWSEKYDFRFNFQGKNNNGFFIEKNDIELLSGGGFESINQTLAYAVEYIEKINNTRKP